MRIEKAGLIVCLLNLYLRSKCSGIFISNPVRVRLAQSEEGRSQRMKNETKWLLGVTIASLFAAALLALIIWGILQAFAGFASYVNTWPLFVMFPVSVALSVLGLWLAHKTGSSRARWLGYVINGLALAVPSLILFFVGNVLIHMDRARYIVPQGYQGYVYILHGFVNGAPEEKGRWEVTYRIPSDGVLVSQAPEAEGFRGARYYY